MNDEYVYSLIEYREYCWRIGVTDETNIEYSYKLYLALLTGDSNEIKKANRNHYYNTYYKAIGKLN